MEQGIHVESVRSAWVVVPIYNESAVASDVLRQLLEIFPHVVVVDDGSTDGSTEVVAPLPVHLLRHPVNLGQGAALQTGIVYALSKGAEFVATFDSDGQMDPKDLATAVRALASSAADVCFGTRFSGGAATVGLPLSRRLALQAAVALSRGLFGDRQTDVHNGLRVFRRQAASRLKIRADRMAHATDIVRQVQRCRLRWIESPVTIRYTPYSLKKGQRTMDVFNILWDILFG